MVTKSNAATVTNAYWTFPATTSPGPSAPIAANNISFSTNSFLSWTEANNSLAEGFILHSGNTTALEFSYSGNHASYLNGSTLTLVSTISDLPFGGSLTNISLSYDTEWNISGNNITESWAYSVNGGLFVNFGTNSISGGAGWLTFSSTLTGVSLNNGDTIAFRDTITGAAGNNGKLDFDNILISSKSQGSTLNDVGVVPEPSSFAILVMGGGILAMHVARVNRRQARSQIGFRN